MVDFLSGTPSIVLGLFGFAMILLLRRTLTPKAQTSLFLANLLQAIMIVRASERLTSGSG